MVFKSIMVCDTNIPSEDGNGRVLCYGKQFTIQLTSKDIIAICDDCRGHYSLKARYDTIVTNEALALSLKEERDKKRKCVAFEFDKIDIK